jgi:predicted CoA-binding protein
MASNTKSIRTDYFKNVKSIAVVGVSENKTKFGQAACRELKKRGFAVFPIHPTLDTFDGGACFHSLADLPTVPDCALVAIKPTHALEVVRQIAQRGTRKVWFQQGKNFSEAIKLAEQLGLKEVHGRCILMYAGEVTGMHRFHRSLSRFFGKY